MEVPGPSQSVLPDWSELLWTSRNLSQLVGTCRNLSRLVATSRNSCGLKGPTLGPYISKGLQVYCLRAASIVPAGLPAVSCRPEGRRDGPADLARSTAEGVGGLTCTDCTAGKDRLSQADSKDSSFLVGSGCRRACQCLCSFTCFCPFTSS